MLNRNLSLFKTKKCLKKVKTFKLDKIRSNKINWRFNEFKIRYMESTSKGWYSFKCKDNSYLWAKILEAKLYQVKGETEKCQIVCDEEIRNNINRNKIKSKYYMLIMLLCRIRSISGKTSLKYAKEAAALDPSPPTNPIFVGFYIYELSWSLIYEEVNGDDEFIKEGKKMCKIALKKFEGNIWIHLTVGCFYRNCKAFNKAEKQFRLCFNINDEYFGLNYEYAYLLYLKKQYKNSIEYIGVELKKNKNYATAICLYAMCLRELKKFHESEKHFKKSLKIKSLSLL